MPTETDRPPIGMDALLEMTQRYAEVMISEQMNSPFWKALDEDIRRREAEMTRWDKIKRRVRYKRQNLKNRVSHAWLAIRDKDCGYGDYY